MIKQTLLLMVFLSIQISICQAQMPAHMMSGMKKQVKSADLPNRDKPVVITLNNGMEFLLVENHASSVIASTVVVKTGSRNETIELSGATHFLEHLLFNGTETRSQKQLYDEMDFLGGYNNANTTHDHTNFMILLEKSNFEKGLEIQADMLFNSILPPEKFEKEKGIVIEEIGKDEDSEHYRVERFFNQTLFRDTPYQWPILGSRQSILNLTREQVWEYYKTFYVPNNMTVFIVGDFNSPDMIDLIERVFGKQQPHSIKSMINGKRELLASSFYAPLRPKIKQKMYLFQGKATSHYVRYALPAPNRSSSIYHSFIVMMEILNKYLSQSLAGKDSGISSISVTHFVDASFATLNIDLVLNPTAEYPFALMALEKSLAGFKSTEIEDNQVQAVTMSIRSEDLFNSERPHYFGMLKSADLAQVGPYFLLEYQDKLRSVTKDDIASLIDNFIRPENAVTAVFQAVKNDEKSTKSQGEKRTLHKQLENGMTVVISQEQDNPIFAAHFLFKHRSAYEVMLNGKPGMVDFLHHILEYGPKGYDKQKFEEELQRNGARAKFFDMSFIPYDDYYTSPQFSYVRVEGVDDAIQPVMRLLATCLMHPKITPEVIESVQNKMIVATQRDQESVRKRGSVLYKSLIYGDAPLGRSISGSSDHIASYSQTELSSFSRLYFSPQNLILTIVTRQEPNLIMKQMEKLFGEWSKGSPLPSVTYSRPDIDPERREESGGKEQSFFGIGYSFPLLETADKAPLKIMNAILSERLQFQLREKEGLAYSLGSSVVFHGNWSVWSARMGTGSANLERAEEGIRHEIAATKKQKFTENEIIKARNAYLGRLAMRTLTRLNRAYYIGLSILHDEPIDHQAVWIDELKKVTADDVDRVAEQYLQTDSLSVAIIR